MEKTTNNFYFNISKYMLNLFTSIFIKFFFHSGILKEVKTFEGSILLKMQLNEKEKWWKKYKISVMSHLKNVLVENVGKSLHDYIR